MFPSLLRVLFPQGLSVTAPVRPMDFHGNFMNFNSGFKFSFWEVGVVVQKARERGEAMAGKMVRVRVNI